MPYLSQPFALCENESSYYRRKSCPFRVNWPKKIPSYLPIIRFTGILVLDKTVLKLKEKAMILSWVVIFLILALVAGLLGFGGLAGSFAGIAKILFIIFIVIVILAFLGLIL